MSLSAQVLIVAAIYLLIALIIHVFFPEDCEWGSDDD